MYAWSLGDKEAQHIGLQSFPPGRGGPRQQAQGHLKVLSRLGTRCAGKQNREAVETWQAAQGDARQPGEQGMKDGCENQTETPR